MTKTSHPMTLALASDREILVTRVFDAPARLIFEAHTQCEHLKRWIGPRSVTLARCDNDFREGGAYRFVYRTQEGFEFAFHGEYREIVPYTRLVTTEVFEMEEYPDLEPAINTMTLEERDGRLTVVCPGLAFPLPETMRPAGGNRAVTLGVRPSSFNADPARGAPVELKVAVAEYLGAQTVLATRLPDGTEVLVETSSANRVAAGEVVTMGIDTSEILLFDRESGRTL